MNVTPGSTPEYGGFWASNGKRALIRKFGNGPQLFWANSCALHWPNYISSACMFLATLLVMMVLHMMQYRTFQKVWKDLMEDPTQGDSGMSSWRTSNSGDSQNHQEWKLSCGHKGEMTGEGAHENWLQHICTFVCMYVSESWLWLWWYVYSWIQNEGLCISD